MVASRNLLMGEGEPAQTMDVGNVADRESPQRPRIGSLAFFALLAVLAGAVFAPAARVNFFADDFGYLNLTLPDGWWYSGDVWDFASQVVRPVTVILIGVQREIFGYDPLRFHITAMALVVAEGVLIWRLARRLGVGEFGARAAAAVLVLHATNGYVIGWTAATSSIFVVLVALVLANVCAVSTMTNRRAWCSALLLVVALLTREVALVLPAMITLVRVGLGEGRWTDRLRTAIGEVRLLWFTLGAYLLLRFVVSGYARSAPDPAQPRPILNWTSFSDAFPQSHIALRDLTLLASSPYRYILDHEGLSWQWWVVLVGIATWIGVLALVSREVRAGRWIALIGLCWFLVGLVPPAFLQAEITYVNYVDLALPGLALAVGAGLDGLVGDRPVAMRRAVGAVGLIVLAWVAFNGGNTLVHPRPPLVTRPVEIEAQIRRDYPEPPPHGSTVVIRDAQPNDFMWTSRGDLVRVMFDDPSLVVVFEPPAG